MKRFTNLYSLSKTLRFELIPQRETLENIKKSGILEQDDNRAEKYKRVKQIIDEYHKCFIEKSLKNKKIDDYFLNSYLDLFKIKNKNDSQKKSFNTVEEKLRQQIITFFDKNQLKRLFGSELIKEDLPKFTENEEEKSLIGEFDKFTTYFVGFHENRKNIYSDEKKSTSIAYRLINDNLPKFINNIFVFEKILKTEIVRNFTELYENIKKDLKDNNISEISDIFKLEYYSNVLTQTQIDIYNSVIGGKILEDGTKIKGLNEYINLYNQQQSEKLKRLPKFTILFKQILSDRISASWLSEKFTNDNEVLKSIGNIYSEIEVSIQSLKSLLNDLKDFDLSKIYLRNDIGLTDISQKFFGNYSVITTAVKGNIREKNPQKKKETQEKYDERINKLFKNNDSFSIGFINNCIKEKFLADYFISSGKNEEQGDLFAQIEEKHSAVEVLLNTQYPKEKSLIQDKKSIELIKEFLDSIKNLEHFVKPLLGSGDEADREAAFYSEFEKLWTEIDKITPLYNKVRNYATKKPYSVEKIKLNFENSTLLAGWDINKEKDNSSIILRKNGLYYLVIMDIDNRKVFEGAEADGTGYEKMEYKLLPGANKMLPKVFFSDSRIKEFNPSDKLIKNYENETHKKGDKFNIADCHALIDFFKASINKHEEWKNFNFKFSDTKTYKDLSGFYREVEQQGYKITFRNISEEYINKLVEEGKIYLFQIYNKDFSEFSKGTPNMHTLYWKALFDEDNLKNVVYKLNGQAEIFYRKGSIAKENTIIHKANNAIENKNINNKKKESKFKYDIIKDRRYTVDKFQFHVPITMNFKAVGNERINEEVNQFIKDNNIKHIIGIDRGERHLLYLSLIDLSGNIVKQFSLNEIINEYNGNSYKTNYHNLLEKREAERDKSRKSWQTIETIKELKEGYISQVVHKITRLIIEHNAIVILEDLNFGFKTSRQKVEKQVYQKFEKMLIDKLNYLVDKKCDANKLGGLLKAYQLTNKFESFQKMGKQNGFLFYIPAWNTSKMDPVTGFVNLFDTHYTNVENAQKFFEKFEDIKFNEDKNYFEFVVKDYTKFNSRSEDTRQNWVICTNKERIKTFRNKEKNNQWDYQEIKLTEQFILLFEKNNIDYKTNLKNQIINCKEKDFFEELLFLFKLTLQMRNSITGTEIDYLISPVADKTGNFFDSRKNINNLPNNADANGAYNIARKGLWVIEQIKQADNLKKINLAITNKQWLQFVQKSN